MATLKSYRPNVKTTESILTIYLEEFKFICIINMDVNIILLLLLACRCEMNILSVQAVFKSRNEQNAAARAKEEAEKIMQKLDTDHNKKLSEDEFIHAAKSCPSVLKILQCS